MAQDDRRLAQEDRRLVQEDRRRRDEQDRRAQAARVGVAAPERYEANAIEGGLHASYTVVINNDSHDTIGRGTIISVVDPPGLRLEPVDNPVIEVRRLIAGRHFADSVRANSEGALTCPSARKCWCGSHFSTLPGTGGYAIQSFASSRPPSRPPVRWRSGLVTPTHGPAPFG